MESLKLDGKILKPMADLLETTIQGLMADVVKKNKVGEITLKLELATMEREHTTEDEFGNAQLKTWTEPIINYQLTEKIKETKAVNKGGLGQGYMIETDDILDDIIIQEIE